MIDRTMMKKHQATLVVEFVEDHRSFGSLTCSAEDWLDAIFVTRFQQVLGTVIYAGSLPT